MGCASSNPLVEGGKTLVQTAKESVHEIAIKGDQVVHNVGETAKEGIETVKDKIGSVVESAEDSVQYAVHKITESFNNKQSEVKETIDKMEKDTRETIENVEEKAQDVGKDAKNLMLDTQGSLGNEINKFTDNAHQRIISLSTGLSDKKEELEDEINDEMNSIEDSISTTMDEMKHSSEGVMNSVSHESEKLASELRSSKDMAFNKFDKAKKTINESTIGEIDSTKQRISNNLNEIDNSLKNVLKLEDVDDSFEMIDDESNNDLNKKVLKRLPTPVPPGSVDIIPKKEPATSWKTVTDLYRRKPALKHSTTIEVSDSDLEAEVGSPHNDNELDSDVVFAYRSLSQGHNELTFNRPKLGHTQSAI